MKLTDIIGKTNQELKTMCRERNIKGFSGKNKKGLIDLLTADIHNMEVMVPTQRKEPISSKQSVIDLYSPELLTEQYYLHKSYVEGRMRTTRQVGVTVRLPSIPEDISENIIKYIIIHKLNDTTTRWNCKTGDLHSEKEGKQECKCFTSDGPLSFTPSSEWDCIYFLDARKWLENTFTLYKTSLRRTSQEWNQIRVSKKQTFEDQTKQGRRPRINWELLYPQIQTHCIKVYEGTFCDIFTVNSYGNPPVTTEEVGSQ